MYVVLFLFLAGSVKIVNLQGLPTKELTHEMVFDFPIDTLGVYSNILCQLLLSSISTL